MPFPRVSIQNYLRDTIGLTAELRPWRGKYGLPYFLQDAFELQELTVLDQPVLLVIERRAAPPPLSELRRQLEKIKATSGLSVIYATDTLTSYERKRLIEHKVPFVVPGNQLYLPDLAIDLREHFRAKDLASARAALSPSAQALLIAALLRKPWQVQWQGADVAARLGYTPMTLSRAMTELTHAGIATAHAEGRSRVLRMNYSPGEVWERVRPLLRSPVKRTFWANDVPGIARERKLLAGLSALSHHSMLTEPRTPVYALSPAQWKAVAEAGVGFLPEPSPGVSEWQAWSYDPAPLTNNMTVDVLSLTLSLQHETDDRVQLALDELKEHFPW